jgi:hypothetical protein
MITTMTTTLSGIPLQKFELHVYHQELQIIFMLMGDLVLLSTFQQSGYLHFLKEYSSLKINQRI